MRPPSSKGYSNGLVQWRRLCVWPCGTRPCQTTRGALPVLQSTLGVGASCQGPARWAHAREQAVRERERSLLAVPRWPTKLFQGGQPIASRYAAVWTG